MSVYDSNGRLRVNPGPLPISVAYGDTANIDAFGRLRVSSPVGLFDSQFQYDAQALLWESGGGGGAVTHNANGWLEVATAGSTEPPCAQWNQSRQYIRYQPGRSQLILCTFQIPDNDANSGSMFRVGYFEATTGKGSYLYDMKNGVAFQYVGVPGAGAASFVIADNEVLEEMDQSTWNIDQFNGLGPSGITADWSKSQIFWTDLEWLGVGRVRVGLCIDGILYPAHEFLHANSITDTYMQTANLPIRYEVQDAALGGSKLLQICSAVFSEGGFESDRGYPFSFGNSITGISVTTRRAILSIRPKATFNSIVNRGTILPEGFDLTTSSAAAQTIFWELIYNPTYTTGGGALTWTSADANSITEYSIHADANAGAFTGGTRILSGYLPSSNSGRVSIDKEIVSRLPLVLDAAGANPRALALVATATGATTCYSALNWRELR